MPRNLMRLLVAAALGAVGTLIAVQAIPQYRKAIRGA